jgi:hypothetical protein
MSRLIDNGGPAFPVSVHNPYNPGMTLRDHFAGLAMQGFLADGAAPSVSKETISEMAYAMADAMLLERQQ